MSTIASLKSWSSGEVLTHTDLNSNFSEIRTTVNTYGMFTDVARTITAVQTFSAVPVFSAGATITTGGLTVSAGGITVTGNSTITGTLGGITTLTATSIAGTITTAAQPNITSFGTLTSLTMSGALSGVTTFGLSDTITTSKTGGSALTFSGAAPTIRIGATTLDITTNNGSANFIRFANANGVSIANAAGTAMLDLRYAGGNNVTLTNTGGQIELGGAGIATNATANMPQIATCAGSPSGSVSDGALVVDTTNHRLYVREAGAWKYATLT